MPPSMSPDSPDGPEGDVAPKPARAQKARPHVKAARVATLDVPAPNTNAAPGDEPSPARKGTSTRGRKAHEQRGRVARQASSLLKFVSDPTRLQVLMILAGGEHHVGALCDQLGQSQPAVSHHLALLRHGGVIVPRRAGKNNFYSLSESGRELAEIARILLQTE